MQNVAGRTAKVADARAMPVTLGFREGTTSVHTSRTMMLDELSLRPGARWPERQGRGICIGHRRRERPGQADADHPEAHRQAARGTLRPRPACTLFRLLRHFWAADAGWPADAGVSGCRRPRSAAAGDHAVRAGHRRRGPVTPEQISRSTWTRNTPSDSRRQRPWPRHSGSPRPGPRPVTSPARSRRSDPARS